ncbi:amino acid permease-domain-containing protein [Geopyxis carbonaria]|nr:amino acid permease-domain-containing protein [Geopyxis carbonaria]
MASSNDWSREASISLQHINSTSTSHTPPPPPAHPAPHTTEAAFPPASHLRAPTLDSISQHPSSRTLRPPSADEPWLHHHHEEASKRSDSDGFEFEGRRARPRVQPGGANFGTYYDLRPLLVRRHILMISLSGTIGVGILISSGQIIKLTGSGGALLSYFLTGFIIHCVMSSLGEMVSLIPEAGALMEYPTRFIDGALGWTIAGSYWFAYAMGVCTLTTSTAILVKGWETDVGQGWIITAILVVVILINVFGVRVFGEIEYVFGFMKVILLVGLTILMLAINRGAGPKGRVIGIDNWKAPYRFPPNFGGIANPAMTPHLPATIGGTLGQFLSVWKGMTIAAFAYIGVEIVAVTASEAKYPRDDLPRATRRIFWLTFSLYVSAVFFVSLNVPYTDAGLLNLYDQRPTTGNLSPFVIAIKNAGIDVLPGFINAALLFASWSTTNSSVFVASRTLYGMATKLDPAEYRYLSILGRTTRKGVPMTAIFASCIFAPLAYLQCGGKDPQELLSVFSQVETVACLIVWMCQCLAFIRFYNGLQSPSAPHDRLSNDYPYRSAFQPWTAYFGFTGCFLLILFNGFDVFLFQPFVGSNFLAAYLAVIVFAAVYALLKCVRRAPLVARSQMDYSVHRENFDRRRAKRDVGRVRGFLSWVFG